MKIHKKTKMIKKNVTKNILFFEKTPFMGVELLNLITNNFKLISYFDDNNLKNLKKLDYSVETFSNNNYTIPIDSDKAVYDMLSDERFIRKLTKNKYSNNLALLFYMSEKEDIILRKIKMNMALPSYKIQEKIGNKIFLNDICIQLGIEVNKSLTIEQSKRRPSEIFNICSKELGIPFIIQGSLGVSGEDTYKIISEQELINFIPKLENKFKASKFLASNIPVSVHICITKNKIDYEGPYIQIIGFKELAKNPFQFSGNDTNQKIFTEKVKKTIFDLSIKLSEYSKNQGYRGIMGIDFLWVRETNKVFVQEINSRLVGLTRLLTGIQKEQKITPHLIKHINEFSHTFYNTYFKEKAIDLSKHDYAQIYLAHNEVSKLTIKRYLLPGIYKIVKNKLIRTKNSFFVSDMDNDEVLINYSAYEGMLLQTDTIISKLIIKKSILQSGKYKLNQELINLIELLKREVL